MLLLLCFWSSIVLFVGLMVYYGWIYAALLRQPSRKENLRSATQPGISILLYTHNQLDQLRNCLSVILTQDYPCFEVIVIDDDSTDGTEEWLIQTKQEFRQLHYTFIPRSTRFIHHRGLAFLLGAKAAHYDILLFTEADCTPLSDQWLSTVANHYQDDTEVLIGFCRYTGHKGLLQQRIAFENLREGMRYLAAACSGHPYAGDNRNLSYRRSLLWKQPKAWLSQFAQGTNEQNRFIRQTATHRNTLPFYEQEGLTEMEPMDALSWDALLQKRRQHTKSGNLMSIWFGLETVGFCLFPILVVSTCVLSLPTQWPYTLVVLWLYVIRLWLCSHLYKQLANRLGQHPFSYRFHLLEWMSLFHQFSIRLSLLKCPPSFLTRRIRHLYACWKEQRR